MHDGVRGNLVGHTGSAVVRNLAGRIERDRQDDVVREGVHAIGTYGNRNIGTMVDRDGVGVEVVCDAVIHPSGVASGDEQRNSGTEHHRQHTRLIGERIVIGLRGTMRCGAHDRIGNRVGHEGDCTGRIKFEVHRISTHEVVGAGSGGHVIGVGIAVIYKLLGTCGQFNRTRGDMERVVAVNGVVVVVHTTYLNGQRSVVNVSDGRHCCAPILAGGLVLDSHCRTVRCGTGGSRCKSDAVIHLDRVGGCRAGHLHSDSTGDGLREVVRHIVVVNAQRGSEGLIDLSGGSGVRIDTRVGARSLHRASRQSISRYQLISGNSCCVAE